MSEEDIFALNERKTYKTRERWYSPYSNTLYKMARDGYSFRILLFFLLDKVENTIKTKSIINYLCRFLKRNFPNRPRLASYEVYEYVQDESVTVIKRKDICKWIFSNSLTKKQKEYLELIMKEYPIVEEIYETYHSFHTVIMGDRPELLEDFLESYEESMIQKFCLGLKKDIAATTEAISSKQNSGWVEGLNTKFKVIKRILYGRSKTVNLEKKFRFALYDFNATKRIRDLLKKPVRS